MNVRPKSPQERQNWRAMVKRCTNPKHVHFDNYGGRGVTVCPAWLTSFEAFYRDMGPKPSPTHSLDRFPNSNGNYEPGNVRWATPTEQTRNRGDYSHVITAFGATRNLSEWCEIYDLWPNTIKHRLSKGWTTEAAVSTPGRLRGRKVVA